MKFSKLLGTFAFIFALGASITACSPAPATPATTTPAVTTPALTTPTITTPAATNTPTTPAPTSTAPATVPPATSAPNPTGYSNPELLVDVKWLNDHIADSNMVIIDTRSASDYAAGHIKNSINIPPATFDGVSASVPSDKSDLINVQEMAAILTQLRISNTSKIILYGVNVDANPARVFWDLEYLGASDVHVLNGGITRWKSAGYAVTNDAARALTDSATFVAKVNDKALATKAYVLANYNNPKFAVVDSRNAADWIVKRIPGSINILVADYLNADGTVKSFADLDTLLTSKGITTDKTIITHCYVGYRSAQAYFIYRLLGYQVSNYDGSSTEWFADPTLPVEPK